MSYVYRLCTKNPDKKLPMGYQTEHLVFLSPSWLWHTINSSTLSDHIFSKVLVTLLYGFGTHSIVLVIFSGFTCYAELIHSCQILHVGLLAASVYCQDISFSIFTLLTVLVLKDITIGYCSSLCWLPSCRLWQKLVSKPVFLQRLLFQFQLYFKVVGL